MLNAFSFRNSGPFVQIAVAKGKGISEGFYNIVVLRKLRTKMRKNNS